MSKEHDEGRWNLERDSIFFFPFFSNPSFSISLSFLHSIYLFISYSYSYSVFVSSYVSSLCVTLLSISFPLCLFLSVCLFLFQYLSVSFSVCYSLFTSLSIISPPTPISRLSYSWWTHSRLSHHSLII